MRRPLALILLLTKPLGAPITTAAWLAVSLAAAHNGNVSPSPSDPIPSASSTPSPVVPVNLLTPSPPNTNHSLSLINDLTADTQFHIPDSPIDLTFTAFGSPILYRTLRETVELALNEISSNVDLQPAESITNGAFSKRHDALEISVHEYSGKQVSWWLLHQLLLGIQYYASQPRRSRELRFEIDVEGKGRVGRGSVWDVGLPGSSDVAKRAKNNNSTQQLAIMRPSTPAPTNSSHPLLSPILNDSHIIFSYHFFGPTIPESAVTLCFELARQSIRPNVERHPLDPIPNGAVEYRFDSTPVAVSVEAYPYKEISWLLLNRILRDVSEHLIGERELWECEFEFEIEPFLEPHGRGYVEYVLAADVLSRRARDADRAVDIRPRRL